MNRCERDANYVRQFQLRVLQDALNEGTSVYWLRRAAAFAAVGNTRCDEIARACRAAAWVAMYHYPGEERL